MTVDYAGIPGSVESTLRRQVFKYTGPTYVTGGDAITPNDFRMGKIFAVLGGYISNGTAVRLIYYDLTNQKLMAFVPNTGAEVANGVDLSGYTGYLEVVGQ